MSNITKEQALKSLDMLSEYARANAGVSVVIAVGRHCNLLKNYISDKQDKVTSVGPYITIEEFAGQGGWVCARCGRGNSPLTSSCPCVPMPAMKVTC